MFCLCIVLMPGCFSLPQLHDGVAEENSRRPQDLHCNNIPADWQTELRNGHILQILLSKNSNATQTTRMVMDNITPRLSCPEGTIASRVKYVKLKVDKLRKQVDRDWTLLLVFLDLPFNLDQSKYTKDPTPITPNNPEGAACPETPAPTHTVGPPHTADPPHTVGPPHTVTPPSHCCPRSALANIKERLSTLSSFSFAVGRTGQGYESFKTANKSGFERQK